MRSAGLHFGHDASTARVDDGGITSYLAKERQSRVKHALGLSASDVLLAGILDDDVPFGITTTQSIPIMLDPPVSLEIDGARETTLRAFIDSLSASHPYRGFASWYDTDCRAVQLSADRFPWHRSHNEFFFKSFDALSMIGSMGDLGPDQMSVPLMLSYGSERRHGHYYDHHFCHALYAAHQAAGHEPALVVTGDGDLGPTFAGGGIYFWRPDKGLKPVTPTDGWLGHFFTTVSMVLGFDEAGGPGKLMGLAPYGRPHYVEPMLFGTWFQVSSGYTVTMSEVVARWIAEARIPFERLQQWNMHAKIPDELAADVAASAQMVIEVNTTKLVRAAMKIAARCGFDYQTIVLSGGVALNCPANGNVVEVCEGRDVRVPPGINDEGLSIGAAINAFNGRYGIFPKPPTSVSATALLGPVYDPGMFINQAMERGWSVQRTDHIAQAAELIANGAVVAIFSGRSELGPRALGARSILANPSLENTWRDINTIKHREHWRPLAPIVRAERLREFFSRGPSSSPYMLFNFRTNDKCFPATTHFDHTARVQTVTADLGLIYDLLVYCESNKGIPLLLNTSFNGPGRPIVETFQDALLEAEQLGIQYLLSDVGIFERDMP